ncbi:hypothetical protein PTKIN_Ptkin08bG0012500 [Pterospermum kingtungense]
MYGGRANGLLPSVENHKMFSTALRNIMDPMVNADQFSDFMTDTSRFVNLERIS